MLAHAHVTQTPTCASTCTCTFTCLQSEWDLASGRAPDYAGVMVSLATDALRSRPRGDRRVLADFSVKETPLALRACFGAACFGG